MAQHHQQCQSNQIEQQAKEVQVKVLYVHTSVHILLQCHLIVDRSQAGNGDAAYSVRYCSAQHVACQAVC